MPIFEFTCKDCGEIFEEIVSRSSQQAIRCPKCGSRKVQKLLSRTVVSSPGTSPGTSSCGSAGGFS
ncbi:MAG: zinc ribbon domain-containing protein [Desulfoplanes sp.]|nr:zinc ribbon domain-containing protein [Desulfoplanes sp.]